MRDSLRWRIAYLKKKAPNAAPCIDVVPTQNEDPISTMCPDNHLPGGNTAPVDNSSEKEESSTHEPPAKKLIAPALSDEESFDSSSDGSGVDVGDLKNIKQATLNQTSSLMISPGILSYFFL